MRENRIGRIVCLVLVLSVVAGSLVIVPPGARARTDLNWTCVYDVDGRYPENSPECNWARSSPWVNATLLGDLGFQFVDWTNMGGCTNHTQCVSDSQDPTYIVGSSGIVNSGWVLFDTRPFTDTGEDVASVSVWARALATVDPSGIAYLRLNVSNRDMGGMQGCPVQQFTMTPAWNVYVATWTQACSGGNWNTGQLSEVNVTLDAGIGPAPAEQAYLHVAEMGMSVKLFDYGSRKIEAAGDLLNLTGPDGAHDYYLSQFSADRSLGFKAAISSMVTQFGSVVLLHEKGGEKCFNSPFQGNSPMEGSPNQLLR